MSKLQKSGTPQSMLSRSRANSASLAFRRGDVQISDPIPFSGRNDEPSFPQPPFSSVHLHSDNSLRRAQTSRNGSLAGRSMNDRSHADFTPRQSPPRLQHKRSMNGLREASNPTRSRASRSLTRSYQTLTPQDYRKSSPPNTTLRPKREKSTLKTVMRRLFGKKPAQTRRAARTGPPEHHRSDPGVFMTTPADVDIERESSIATTGLSRSSALGSHSPFATNIHPANELPRTHEFQSQSIQEPSTELRRATLPSIDFSPDEARSIGLTLAAHGHRPLSQDSMDGRRSGNIGFAVTSGSNPKRRSRSAGALRDAARAHRMSPIQWRRRSEEIKYWRESLGEQPLALPIQIPLDTEDPPEEPIVQQEGVPAAGEQDFSAEDNNRRTFDFGPLASSMQKQEAATLEERLSTLEVKLMDLEYAISKLQAQGSSLTKQPASGRYPRRPSGNDSGESAYSVAVAYQDPQRPTASGRHIRTDRHIIEQPSSIHDEPLPATARPVVSSSYSHTASSSTDPSLQPSSTGSTIRPVQEQTSTASHAEEALHPTQLTTANYGAILSFIQHEHSARRKLEEQVLHLQNELGNLRTLHIQEGENKHSASQPRHHERVPRLIMQERRSQESQEQVGFGRQRSSSNYEGETDTDDGYQDVYETPKERKDLEIGGFI